MKKNTMKEHILVILSTFFIMVNSCLMYGVHLLTGYPIYFYIYITSLLFGGTNLLMLLLKLTYRMASKEIEESPKKKVYQQIFQKISRNLPTILTVFIIVGYGLLLLVGSRTIIDFLRTKGNLIYPSVSNVVIFLLLFVVTLILEKLCGHFKGETSFVSAMLENSRMFFKLLSFQALIAATCTVFESLKFFRIQTYVGYVFIAILFYYVVFILLSMIVIGIRKEFAVCPYLNIPLPSFRKSKNMEEESRKTVGFIEYLEKNTGISMRSLWSVKFIREIAPFVVVLSGVFLWISTCIVQVESYQQAAVYRLGVLQKELLEPGIHLGLPYPFDKVEIYDTGVLNKTTIGFRSEDAADNLWTSSHQGEEYKLLLGSSDEVVSINLRLEYKISDLFQYLKSSAAPESILQALAYELVTDQTIHTDLTTLLSTDREAFSQTFMNELTGMLEEKDVGLKVVSVVLESIHPPKEIAEVYQETVSAEIDAETKILEAERAATAILAQAQVTYNEDVSMANSEYVEKVAAAKANVAEFMASVEANKAYGEKYTYQKYLNVLREAYGKANLVIVGEGVDQSAIFFGNFGKEGSSAESSSSGSSSSGNSSTSKNGSNSKE